MITERQEELAALYALDLLEGAERHAFESELSDNPALATLVRELKQTSSSLAYSAPRVTPPPALKARVLAAAEVPLPSSADTRPDAPIPIWRWMPWGIAAALALATIGMTIRNATLESEIATLRDERRLAEIAVRNAETQLAERSLLAERMVNDLRAKLQRSEDLARLKVSALASLAGNTAEAQAIAVWDPENQSGLLTFDKMPVIAESQDYQIWVVDPAYPNPVNGGVFRVDENGRAVLAFKPDQPVHQAAAFAISLEKKGGVPKAEGPIVLLGKITF